MSEKEVSWWEWVQSTKDKVVSQSSEVFELVKKDIEEFSKVVSEETSSVVSSTATSLKEKLNLDQESSSASQMKKSVSGFLNHVAEVFTPSPDDDDQEAIMILNQQPVTLDRLQAAKFSFCSNPSNFLKEPENEKHYESWLQSFNIESHENELAPLLADNDVLRKSYSALVPSQLSHIVFWHKYFYEMEQLEKAEEKRQEMKKRAQEADDDDDQIVWEDADEVGDKVVISEQMQQKLLEDYEKEIQNNSSSESSEVCDSTNVANEKKNRESKSSTPSSKDTEEEWEKVDPENTLPPTVINESESSSSKSEDWEKWE
ncbi:BSD domain-containing protein 1 [Armadillidium nasatum]|uniref:BSD domain-containing protein 1 n=1 Tax=Armadillidium nasatum TaxID=96803 RepID=A0A5N5SJV4_9CRUS|nr:BSD domain-containing protein 1 [Armadillidium nasatum]